MVVTPGRGSSHTVRVCAPGSSTTYESGCRILVDPGDTATDDVTAERVAKLGTLLALESWLASRDALAETPGASGSGMPGPAMPRARVRPTLRVSLPDADDEWVAKARAAVAGVLDAFAADFLQRPYLHRSELGVLHCRF